MEVICKREKKEWKNIHSGRLYKAISIKGYFIIEGHKVKTTELLIYFKVL